MNSTAIQRLLETDRSWGLFALRVPVGIIFMAHGAQKLFGWFGGYGLEGTGGFFATLGLEPGFLLAFLAGSAEFFGGVALVLGFLVRPAAAILAFTMLVAIFAVHFKGGLFLSNNGFEYALALFAVSVALLFNGGGKVSLDGRLARPAAAAPARREAFQRAA
jgi:putative oxidoreductase